MSNPNLVRPRPPRVPFVRPVQVSHPDGSAAQWLLASNISEGGMFVRAAEPPPVGTRLRLELEARGQNLTFAEGEVIWSRPMDLSRLNQGLPGFGVRFGELTDESRALVRHLVDQGGTGRGQAKTLAYTSPEALKLPLREPLHAPASMLMETLTPTDRLATGEFQTLPPEALAMAASEPTLDTDALRAHVSSIEALEQEFYVRPRRAGLGGIAGGLLLCSAAIAGGIFAYRGLHEAAAERPEPVAILAPAPAPLTEALPPASAPAPLAAAPIAPSRPEPVVKAEKPVHARATPPVSPAVTPRPAPVVAVQHSAEAIALPSGAATAVSVSESGAHLEITPSLVPGASIEKVFALSGPERLVIDIKGSAPKGTPRVEGRSGVTAIRLGSRPGGTRLVLDLARHAGKLKTEGSKISVELR
jgi:uncharacterized protein (TIGR02266 family)